jgi:hypothetical protein
VRVYVKASALVFFVLDTFFGVRRRHGWTSSSSRRSRAYGSRTSVLRVQSGRAPPHRPFDAGAPPHRGEPQRGHAPCQAPYQEEIARLLRELDPLPDVPARIEPLGPALARVAPSAPTWDEFVRSMCKVRELGPGERPRDWIGSMNDAEAAVAPDFSPPDHEAVSARPGARQTPPTGPITLSPQRYRVQFTAGEEYVKLIEEARALLSHAAPRATLDEIHVRAMRALMTELKRQKHAPTPTPRDGVAEKPTCSSSTT